MTPFARMIYQATTGQKITQGGWLNLDTPRFIGRDESGQIRGTVAEWLRNKLNPGVSGLAQLGAEKLIPDTKVLGTTGKQIGEFVRPGIFREGVTETGTLLDQIASYLVPLAVQETIQGYVHDGIRGGLLGATSFVGLGTLAYEDSASTQRRDLMAEILQGPDVPAYLQGKTPDELTAREWNLVMEKVRERDPELADELEQQRQERYRTRRRRSSSAYRLAKTPAI